MTYVSNLIFFLATQVSKLIFLKCILTYWFEKPPLPYNKLPRVFESIYGNLLYGKDSFCSGLSVLFHLSAYSYASIILF